MKKLIRNCLFASICTISVGLTMDDLQDHNLSPALFYKINAKTAGNFITYTNEKSSSGHYMQTASYDNPGDDALWHIKPSTNKGYYSLHLKSKPGFFATYTNKKSASGHYMQICSYDNPGDDALWRINASTEKGYYSLYLKSKPGFFATYTGEKSASGHYMQICSYNNPGDDALFYFTPTNYKLEATLEKWQYDDFSADLEKNTKIDVIGRQIIVADEVGISSKVAFSKTITNKLSWELSQSISKSISLTVGVAGGVALPGFGGAGAMVSSTTTVSSGSKTSWSKEETYTFTKEDTVTPKEPGKYEVSGLMQIADNVQIPFRSKLLIKATGDTIRKDGTIEKNVPLEVSVIKSLLDFENLDKHIIIAPISPYVVEADVTGMMKGSYGMNVFTNFKKL